MALGSVADRELRWFFAIQEGTLGSPFVDELSTPPNAETPEAERQAAQAYGQVRGWLLAMPKHLAGVLAVTYTPGPWPRALRGELGRLTGIVVRLASIDAATPDRPCSRDVLEARVAMHLAALCESDHHELLARYEARAFQLFRAARRSYLRQRGSTPCATRGLR